MPELDIYSSRHTPTYLGYFRRFGDGHFVPLAWLADQLVADGACLAGVVNSALVGEQQGEVFARLHRDHLVVAAEVNLFEKIRCAFKMPTRQQVFTSRQ